MNEATAPDLKAITRTARDPATAPEQLQACAGQGDTIQRLLARHPNASAQLLAQLSHSSDRATRKAVTLHPNTPKDALLKLAPQFPADFFKNPAFDWLLIEHPTLLLDIGGGVLKNLLKRAECPQSFMAWAAEHGSEQERLAVAMNPQAQADVLQAIERRGGKAGQAAQQHANHPLDSGECDLESAFRKAVERAIAEGLTAEDVPTLAQWPALSLFNRWGGKWTGCGILSHSLAPPALVTSVMTALAGDASDRARRLAAGNRATPPDALTALAGDSDSWVRTNVAGNPATPVDVLIALARDSESRVRFYVACNSATPSDVRLEFLTTPTGQYQRRNLAVHAHTADVLSKLASDRAGSVRVCVADNPATPVDVLTTLASDSNSYVRFRVAVNPANPATSADVLTTLASDSNSDVRVCVAANPATPVDVLSKLACDSDWRVRDSVAANPATPADVLTTLAGDPSGTLVLCPLAANPATPVATLTALAGDPDLTVRRAVAGNPATLAATLTTLAGDSDSSVRYAVAANPATPAATLTALAGDSDFSVRLSVAANLATPVDVLIAACEAFQKAMSLGPRRSPWWTDQLAKLKPKDGDLKRACETGDVLYLPDELAEKACRKKILAWRLLGLSHQFAAPEELAKRSRSTEWVERMAVARNPNSPPNVIEILRKDPHRIIARQADATATLKAVTTARLEQLLREMSGEPAEEALVHEVRKRLKRRYVSNFSLHTSRWSRCFLPGQWLSVLDANAQVKLETLLPEDLKQAMARFWSNPAIAVDNLLDVHLPSVVMRLANHPDSTVRRAVADNPATPAATLTALAGDPDLTVRRAVAGNPATLAATLTALAGKKNSSWVRSTVAANPATSVDVLTTLASDSSVSVRECVAANPATPAATLTTLAGDPDLTVRHEVAGNPATLAATLTALAGKKNSLSVRSAVAANPATPAATLTTLAGLAGNSNRDLLRRDRVAANPATSVDVLTTLASDPDGSVRVCVAANPATPAATLTTLAGDSDSSVRCAVAANPATLTTVLTTLAGHSDARVRHLVAANPATPAATLTTLVGDENWHVSIAAASNPATLAETLSTDSVRLAAARAELRRALAAETPSPEKSAVIQSWIAELQAGLAEPVVLKDVSDSEFRLAFNALGLMPAEGDKRSPAKAARSKDWLERAAATYAPGIQPSLLKVLLEDPVEAVRQCAVARLRALA